MNGSKVDKLVQPSQELNPRTLMLARGACAEIPALDMAVAIYWTDLALSMNRMPPSAWELGSWCMAMEYPAHPPRHVPPSTWKAVGP